WGQCLKQELPFPADLGDLDEAAVATCSERGRQVRVETDFLRADMTWGASDLLSVDPKDGGVIGPNSNIGVRFWCTVNFTIGVSYGALLKTKGALQFDEILIGVQPRPLQPHAVGPENRVSFAGMDIHLPA